MARTNDFGQPIGEPVVWSALTMPESVTLPGRHVTLTPLVASHAPELLTRLASHPELWTYLGDEPPGDLAAAEAVIAHRNVGMLPFALLDPRSEHLLGISCLMNLDLAAGTIEVGGILYGPELQRTRAATEAQYLLMRHAFDLGFRRYEWKCDSLNAPSRAAALRLGFVEEGTFRNAIVTKGRNRDTTWFSVTDTEWPGLRAAFEQWLDDSNFDDGVQRRSLSSFR